MHNPRLIIVDNRDSFTWNLFHLFKQTEADVQVAAASDLTMADMTGYDAIILSPGPGLPQEHLIMMDIIDRWVKQKPILGVCLGHQALALYYGGQLKNLDSVYHGIRTKVVVNDKQGLWSGIDQIPEVGRYHSWVVNHQPWPDKLIITSMDEDGEIMSMRHRSLPIYSVQFHPESYMCNCGSHIANRFVQITVEHVKKTGHHLR